MPPFVDEEVELSDQERARAWDDGLSNNIIICGKPYPLTKDSNSGFLRVRNFVDDPSLDFIKFLTARGYDQTLIPVRKRKGDPQTPDDLKKAIQFCVLHTDLTKHARGTFDALWSHQPNPLSSHFCINWNGIIYQYADVQFKTSHAGDTNDITIGIDMNHRLVNIRADYNRDDAKAADKLRAKYMKLTKEKLLEAREAKGLPPLTPEQLKRELEKYEQERPVEMKIQTGLLKTWGYAPIQYESLILLLKLFVREIDLAKSFPMGPNGKVVGELLVEDDVKKLKGFVAHWHLCDSRWDPGPAFDWERVLAGLQNEYNSFPVNWDESMQLQGKDAVKAHEAAYELIRSTEMAAQGGTYPIGPNQTWHGGVHIFPPQKNPQDPQAYPVQAMFDGTVVAAHFEPNARELGHNNFVLLKHAIDLPKRKGEVAEDGTIATTKLEFYSLYMHLAPFPEAKEGLTKDAAEAIAGKHEKLTWLKRLFELESSKAKDGPDAVDKALEAFEAELLAQRRAFDEKVERGEVPTDVPGAAMRVPKDVYEAAKVPPAYLTVGSGSGALEKGDKVAALLIDGKGVKVSAGEWLGFTGLMPARSSELRLGDSEVPLIPGVHVEVFATEEMVNLIDLELHAEAFRTPQRARGADLVVKTEDILMMFRQQEAATVAPYGKVQLWPERRLDPDSIVQFFMREPERDAKTGKVSSADVIEAYREQLRRSITYHVSEWSDQVDWVRSLLGEGTWDKEVTSTDFKRYLDATGLFSQEIRRFLPFVWLTGDLAKQLDLTSNGKKWDGRFYYFHPIHFLMWVTYSAVRRNRVFRTSLSLAELRENQKRSAVTQKLGKAGRTAIYESPGAWQRFLADLDNTVIKQGLKGFDEKTIRKNEAKKAEFELFKKKIVDLATGVLELDDHDHDAPETYLEPPMASNPKEVLKSLFEAPGKNTWQLIRREAKPPE